MSTPEARIFKIIQNFTSTMKKIRLSKLTSTARSIFEKEAPTVDGECQKIHLRVPRNCQYEFDEAKSPKKRTEKV